LPPRQVVYVSDGVVGSYPTKGNWNMQAIAPLRVRSIRLPPHAMELRGDVNFFAVDITPEGGDEWRVYRRYDDFHALANRLGSEARSFPDAPFPRKHMFGVKDSKLDGRRRGLEVWLQRAFEHPLSAAMWIGPLRSFAEAGRQMMETPYASGGASALVAAPTIAPSAPPVSTPTAVPDEGCVLELEVPSGVSAGQFLGVGVPDGRQLTLPLPEGAQAGDRLSIYFDPKASTLSLLNHT